MKSLWADLDVWNMDTVPCLDCWAAPHQLAFSKHWELYEDATWVGLGIGLNPQTQTRPEWNTSPIRVDLQFQFENSGTDKPNTSIINGIFNEHVMPIIQSAWSTFELGWMLVSRAHN